MADTIEATPPAVSADDAREKELERLRREVEQFKDEKKKLQKAVKDVPEGVDVGALLKFKADHELRQQEEQQNYSAAKQQLQEQYNRDIAARDARIAELEAKVRDLELITPAASVLAGLVHDPDDVFKTGRLKPEMIEPGTDGPVVVNGLERVPLSEWAKANLPAHYLKAPRPAGTGAPAGGGGSGLPVGSNMKNPFTAPHFSLAEQGRLLRSNPALYQQLKAAAGLA